MTARKLMAWGWMIAISGVLSLIAYAQDYQVEQERVPPRNVHYRVRVVNQMGRPVCVKIIPYGKSNYFHADLDPNESETQDLWAGQRALCVWNDRTGELLITARVHINRSGILRIRPLWAAAEEAEPPAGAMRRAAPATAPPSVEIESE